MRHTLHHRQHHREQRLVSLRRPLIAVLATACLTAGLSACADGADSPQNVTLSQKSTPVTCTTAPTPRAKDQALTLPDKKTAQGQVFIAKVETNCGTITLELDGDKAPQTVASFLQLAKGYYDDTPCHRFVPEFVLQCGDPTGTGQGGPGYTFGIENAPSDNQYPKGTLAMARQANNADSNGGQFFITVADTSIPADSAGGYTIFGKVVGGMDVVDHVAAAGAAAEDANGNTAPNQPISVLKISISKK